MKSILNGFWTDAETHPAIQALEIEGWCDVLENCSHSEIRKAWAEYQKTGPRSKAGRLLRPDAGALYGIIMKSRPRPKLVVVPESERLPVSEESKRRVQKMADEVGRGMRAR